MSNMIDTTREALVAQIGPRLGSKLRDRLRLCQVDRAGSRISERGPNPNAQPHGLQVRIINRPYARDTVVVSTRREGETLIGAWSTVYGQHDEAELVDIEALALLTINGVFAFEDEWTNPPNPYAGAVLELDDPDGEADDGAGPSARSIRQAALARRHGE
jgi:hypothetical protein